MSKTDDRGRLDWLVEVAGACAPAVAAAFAAARLAPLNGWPVASAMLVGGGGAFGAAWIAMRAVPAEARQLALPTFGAVVLEDELVLDRPMLDELLLDQIALDELLLDQLLVDEPMVEQAAARVAELLLDDPLPAPNADSRVVQLFADGRMPSAGQLMKRIDRHLAGTGTPAPVADDSDALSDALAELRRSLRHG